MKRSQLPQWAENSATRFEQAPSWVKEVCQNQAFKPKRYAYRRDKGGGFTIYAWNETKALKLNQDDEKYYTRSSDGTPTR